MELFFWNLLLYLIHRSDLPIRDIHLWNCAVFINESRHKVLVPIDCFCCPYPVLSFAIKCFGPEVVTEFKRMQDDLNPHGITRSGSSILIYHCAAVRPTIHFWSASKTIKNFLLQIFRKIYMSFKLPLSYLWLMHKSIDHLLWSTPPSSSVSRWTS